MKKIKIFIIDDPFCKMEIISISEEEIKPSELPPLNFEIFTLIIKKITIFRVLNRCKFSF